MARFASVILDVDSTLSGIEGIDWLAARRTPEIAREVERLTSEAMAGARPIEDVYRARLELVRPASRELAELAEAYWSSVAPGAGAAIAAMGASGVRVEIVTSGLRDAVEPFAKRLGLAPDSVHAVPVVFDSRGDYSSFDAAAPLCVRGGKRVVASSLDLERPVLAVGDGVTDAEIRPAANEFAAFTGFVHRDAVVAVADYVVGSFAELERLVLGTRESA
ncbi:MAG TPA: HAD-IB family phosphatase [Gemmatimonadaceae bacterium]|nr:HAD-IB family phosphatase [Gemmatimonadaceae bacterium]